MEIKAKNITFTLSRVKQIIAIIFLGLFLAISCRYQVFTSFLSLQKSEFRKTLLNDPNAEILSVEMNKAELFVDRLGFDWKEKNKEWVINGIYHEVVAVVVTHNRAAVYLISDREENQRFKDYFTYNEKSSQSSCDFLHFVLSILYLHKNPLPDMRQWPQTLVFQIQNSTGEFFQFQKEISKPPCVFSLPLI